MDVADEETDIALECTTLAGGRCTPPSAILLAVARGGSNCGFGRCSAEWKTVPPTDLRAGILGAIIVIPGFGFSFFVFCRAVDVAAGTGYTEDMDERTLLRLGTCGGGGGALLQVAAACILLFLGRRNCRTGACGAANDFVRAVSERFH